MITGYLITPIAKGITYTQKAIITFLTLFFNMKPTGLRDYATNIIKLIMLCVIFTSVMYVSITAIISINRRIASENYKKQRLSLNPQIDKIEPNIVYPGIKVIIFGRNFGWKGNENVLLAKGKEVVTTDLWTDTKIIFTVPLHWEPKNISFLIKKSVDWEGKNIVTKSDVVTIHLLSNIGAFNENDKAYFEQLKYLDAETLEINGYE